MPLKASDLKTVDSYKKAVKADGAKINPGSNIKFWVYRDVELPTANGQKQKLPAFIALVDDAAIKPLLQGKPLACRGLCGLQDGKIEFQAAQGKVPYALLKTSVPLLLGKKLHIPTGADADTDAPEIPAAPPLPSAQTPRTPGEGPNAAQLNAAWKELAVKADQLMAANPAQREALTKAKAGIPQMLQGGQLVEARARLDLLQSALKTAAGASPAPPPQAGGRPAAAGGAGQPAGTPYPGLVKYRGALLQFAQAKDKVQAQMGGLQSAIVARWPDKADFAKNLAAEIAELNQELAKAVDEAMKASENQASPATDAIKMKIRKYLTELASNQLIKQADTNPLGVAVTIRQTLGEALGRIRDAMPA